MTRSTLCLVAAGLVTLAAARARADALVAFEVGGLYAYSPLADGNAGGTRTINSTSAGGGMGATPPGHDGVLALTFGPVFTLPSGARIGFGFRAGETGGLGDASGGGAEARVTGGDLSLGFQRRWGNLLPFVEGTFGFSDYAFAATGGSIAVHREQLRLDGVLGAKWYLGRAVYLSGAAFLGVGDRYGATVSIGFDIVRFRKRGLLP